MTVSLPSLSTASHPSSLRYLPFQGKLPTFKGNYQRLLNDDPAFDRFTASSTSEGTSSQQVSSTRQPKGALSFLEKVGHAGEFIKAFLPQLRKEGVELPPSQAQTCLTPLQPSRKVENLFYKREDLTASGAYKVRGAAVAMQRLINQGYEHFVTVSTGNHALGVLKAAELLHPQSLTVVVPETVSPFKHQRLSEIAASLQEQGIDAKLVLKGQSFDEAQALTKASLEEGDFCHAEDKVSDVFSGAAYIDPFGDEEVVSGQATIGVELYEQLKPQLLKSGAKELVVLCPIGGGGLLSGLGTALNAALQADPELSTVQLRLVGFRLADQNAKLGDAIKVKQVDLNNLERLKDLDLDLRATLNDELMAEGVAFVEKDLGVQVEGASAGVLSPLLHQDKRVLPNDKRLVVAVISGGNV